MIPQEIHRRSSYNRQVLLSTSLIKAHRGHGAEANGVLVGDERGGGVSELEAGGPAVGDNVVDLLGDLLRGQRGQVGEGLVLPANEGRREERRIRTRHKSTSWKKFGNSIAAYITIKHKPRMQCGTACWQHNPESYPLAKTRPYPFARLCPELTCCSRAARPSCSWPWGQPRGRPSRTRP